MASTTGFNWTSDHPRFVMDINGDGLADVLGIGPDGVWSCLNRGPAGFNAPTFQLVAFEANSGWRTGDHPRFLADLTGDGRPDLVGFGDDGVWTARGNGDGSFQPVAFALDELGFKKGWSVEFPRFVADLTGDGRADIVGFGMDGIWTALSNGDGRFQPALMVSADFSFNTGWRVDKHPRFVADLTGDQRADILGFGDDGAWVALGNGDGSFQGAQVVLEELGFNQGWRVDKHPRFVVDLTGDGKADIIGFGDDGIWVALGNGDGSFQPARMVSADFSFNTGWRVDDHPRFLADMDGDGKVDIVGFGDDGLWIARNRGDDGFDAARFVLADFGRRSNPPIVISPKYILETNYNNPDFDTSDPNWAKNQFAGTQGDGTFPLRSGREWKQVLSPDEDYDLDSVGASGWVINNHIVCSDFPFSHPFGVDWEFGFAVDPLYDKLVAIGNKTPEDNDSEDTTLGDISKIPRSPNGLLGVEMDRKLVPVNFQNEVHTGNRAVVFGRWIVDCGHDSFRTEIHPPLLMAVAKPTEDNKGTRVVLTSRPYLVSEKYTTSVDEIYDDEAGDDGLFLEHMIKEVGKISSTIGSLTLEAHPKIKSKPFNTSHLHSFTVKPTTAASERLASSKLVVSFHFTVRTGCTIEITTSGNDGIFVGIALNPNSYTAPPLPQRSHPQLNQSDIEKLDSKRGSQYLAAEILLPLASLVINPISVANLEQALLRGIKTDAYEAPVQVDFNETANQILNVPIIDIREGMGITVNNDQPYPVYGWLEVKWEDTVLVSQ